MIRLRPRLGAGPGLALWLTLAAALGLAPVWTWAAPAEPVVAAVQAAGPAVVNVSALEIVQRRSLFGDPFFDRFFNEFFDAYPGPRQETTSLGSGVIIDGRAGHILTNHHVVARAKEVRVTLANQDEFQARVIGSDPGSDLAVLQVEAGGSLPTISLGDSDRLQIGQRVIAIGNPFGLSHTVTTGVVSALNRIFKAQGEVFFGFIQTDAAINPGNSGGALLDLEGRLIGINTAIYAQAQGIGFAIPINKARRVVSELINYGRVRGSWLGLATQTLTPELKAHFPAPRGRGVIVTRVEPGSPADKAGLKKDDVILKVGSLPVASQEGFERVRADYPPGSRMKLILFRDGRTVSATLTPAVIPHQRMADVVLSRLGFAVKDLDARLAARWRIPPGQGVQVSRVRQGSPAADIGLRPGDVLLEMDQQPVNSPAEFLGLASRLGLSRPFKILVQRRTSRYLVTLRPEG
ncbi:MAG: trypsin-like peptidase domain-containing protein [Deltaproteobacteria bacterium]|nr:trypsin-like peptidase domain-containing protein [Deltaproteobacteria bacterium]